MSVLMLVIITTSYIVEPNLKKNMHSPSNYLYTHGGPRTRSCQCSSGLNWNLEMLIFEEREKPEFPEKNLSGQSTMYM